MIVQKHHSGQQLGTHISCSGTLLESFFFIEWGSMYLGVGSGQRCLEEGFPSIGHPALAAWHWLASLDCPALITQHWPPSMPLRFVEL